MGMLATLRDWFGSPGDPGLMTRAESLPAELRAAVGPVLFSPTQLNKPIWTTGNPARYVTEGWGKAPVVFACVLALADAASTAPVIVKDDIGNGRLEPAEDSALQALLDRPNPMMDQAEFIAQVVVNAALSGFCVIEKERSVAGDVIGLWPLRADWLRPIPRAQSAPAWEVRIPGHRDPFIKEPEDVIVHTHAPDPNLGYRGTAPMAVAFRELGIENAMTDFLKAFFDRGALPVYGIIPKQAIQTQEQADAFREKIVGKYGGALKSAEPMLLAGVDDVKRLGFDFDELAYPELRALSETSICTAFRVPPILVGVQAGLEHGTYSNYGQARRAFYEDVVASLWRRLDGALSRSLVPEFDSTGKLSVAFDTGDVAALKDDENGLWQRATAALSAGGISTHTYQRQLGLDPHGPDVIYRPFSVTPIPVGEGDAEAGDTERRRPTRPAASRAALPAGHEARSIPYDSEEHRQRWERRLSVTESWEREVAEVATRQFELQRLDVLDVLAGGGRDRREIAIDTPFDREKWIRLFRVAIRPAIFTIVTQQAALELDELGVLTLFDVQDPNVIRAMERQAQRFAEEVNDTTWQALRATLAEGIDAGEGIGQLAERVEAVMVDRIRSSKEAIARTEVTTASTTGTLASWEQSGVVVGKQWLAALDDRTRKTHVEAHGQIVGLDEDFRVGGAVGPGPGNMGSAKESINCRCSMVPVVDTAVPTVKLED